MELTIYGNVFPVISMEYSILDRIDQKKLKQKAAVSDKTSRL